MKARIVLIAGLAFLSFAHESGRADVGRQALEQVVAMLARTPTGQALLLRAQQEWELQGDSELVAKLKFGDVSKTDSILTRRFDPFSGSEKREREVTVFLRLGQPLIETVLDLAHELVHAIHGPEWDPYDSNLTLGRFITASLDGTGGEVHALATECEVATDLAIVLHTPPMPRCERYMTSDGGKIDPRKIQKDFYKVGSEYHEIRKKLGMEATLFQDLSSEAPVLFSSTGNAPYPVALAVEYEAISASACQNMKNRYEALRVPLIDIGVDSGSELDTARFLRARCSSTWAAINVL